MGWPSLPFATLTLLASCGAAAGLSLAAPLNASLDVGLGCLAEWQTCTGYLDDEPDPCCSGLYCCVKSLYYAQCVASDDDTPMEPTPTPTMAPIPSPTPKPTARPVASPTTAPPVPFPPWAHYPTPRPTARPNPAPTARPRPAPTARPNPAPTPEKNDDGSVYSCGAPLEGLSETVEAYYEQWVDEYVVSRGSGLCVQRPSNGGDCVSEGTGYGMLLAAQLQDQTTFDGLWAFAQEHFNGNGLMSWQISSGNSVQGSGSATDADLDMALGLAIATTVWGDSYADDTVSLMEAILDYDVDSSSYILLPGDSWNNVNPMPTNPSYFSPAHFRVFYSMTGNSQWLTMIDAGYALLEDCTNYNSGTGLVPDWTYDDSGCTPGTYWVSDTGSGTDYYYDATRTPWRLSLDLAWTCSADAQTALEPLQSFFQTITPDGMSCGFTLYGTGLSGNVDNAFMGPASTTMVALDADNNTRETWNAAVEGLWENGTNYFSDTLAMLAMVFNAGMMPQPDVDRR